MASEETDRRWTSFTLSQILEKYHEFSHDLHCLFVDFQQPFDSINRVKIAPILTRLGILQKLIRLIKMTLNIKARVLIQGKLIGSFDIVSGVKQGNALSTLIFNLMLHSILKDVDPGATMATKSTQICASDDVAIIARNVEELKSIFMKMARSTDKIGLRVNVNKTKYLAKTKSEKLRDLVIGNYRFEAVSQFTNLGMIFTSNADNNCGAGEDPDAIMPVRNF